MSTGAKGCFVRQPGGAGPLTFRAMHMPLMLLPGLGVLLTLPVTLFVTHLVRLQCVTSRGSGRMAHRGPDARCLPRAIFRTVAICPGAAREQKQLARDPFALRPRPGEFAMTLWQVAAKRAMDIVVSSIHVNDASEEVR